MPSALLVARRPRALAMSVVVALVAGLVAVLAAVPAARAADDPQLGLSAVVTESVLSGAPATVTLTARNRSEDPRYNLGYSYVVPAGVTLTGTATSRGTAIGAPTSTTTLTDGSTLLVWANVSDLVVGDEQAITFDVVAAAGTYPVGSVFGGRATAAASTDPRTIPTFDTGTDPTNAGSPRAGDTVRSASATANTTTVSAIRVQQDEVSPEHELVRGVHDQPTTWSVTVTNTETAATSGVTVTELLPAGLEFLGCGTVDNTTTGPEYPGAPSLVSAAPLEASECPQATSVRTRDDVPGESGKVFTEVVWSLGTLAPGATTTIRYRAAVPLAENTMTFRAGSAPAPAPDADRSQAANLDNNTGASTRQDGPSGSDDRSNGQGQTSVVTAAGTYTGAVAAGASAAQTDRATLTVEAMDLAVAKAVDTDPSVPDDQADFRTGQTASYRLLVRASEYERSSDLVLTDTLPNGLCPVVPSDTPTTGAFPAECDPAADRSTTAGRVTATAADGSDVPVSVDQVAYDAASGEFAMTLSVADVPAGGTVTVRYGALMRTTYSSTTSAGPTAAGDAFTNDVRLRATSHAVEGRGDTGATTVVDDSAATITSGAPSIDKTVLARPADGTTITDASQCAAQTGYGDAVPTYGLGDTVCFRLAVTFPAGVQSRNATITDMLPTGTTNVSGGAWTEGTDWVVGSAPAGSENPTVAQRDGSTATTATFSLGSTVAGASGTYVDGTRTHSVVLFVAARVTQQGSSAARPDVTANLVKYAQQSTDGTVTSLRDQADYRVAGAPTTTLTKTVQVVGSNAAASTNVTGVQEGQQLQYRLRFTNTAASSSTVTGATVWDALPAGITCSGNAVTVPDGAPARCSDTAPGPVPPAYAGRQFLVWTVPATAPGSSVDLTTTLTLPARAYVGTAYANSASVVRFTTATTTPDVSTTWVPTPSTSFPSVHTTAADTRSGQGTAPNTGTNARSTATIAQLGVDKQGGAVPAATNRRDGTAVPGQGLAYTYTGTVPAHTSAGSAVLSDPLPAGIETTADTVWALTLPGGTAPAATRTVQDGDTTVTYGGQSFTFTGGGSTGQPGGSVVFPDDFDNTGDTALAFSVRVTGLRVAAGVSSTNTANATYNGENVVNTARFVAKDPATKAVTSNAWRSATVNVQAAAVGLEVRHTPTPTVTGADDVTWTLTVRNVSGTTDARSVLVADCLPNAFEYRGSSAPLVSLTDAQRDAVGCDAATTTAYAWSMSTVAPNGSAAVTVKGRLGENASATSVFTNRAVALQSSLDTDYATTGRSYVQRVETSDDVVVAAPVVTKTLTAPGWDATTGARSTADATPARTVRAGDTGSYTITATVPAAVALHDGVVSDVLPDGVQPAGDPTARVVSGEGVSATPAYDASTRTVTVRLSDIGADQTDGVRVEVTVPVRIGTRVAGGTPVRNTATLAFDRVRSDDSTRASRTSESSSTTVVTPNLGITKEVVAASGGSGTFVTAQPGDALRYTVRVTNTGGSPAYGTDVVDCVPDGVRIDPDSVGDGGAFAEPADGDRCGGGTITWTGLTVGTAATRVLSYDAALADGADLDGTARDNTVRVATYRSLPAPDGDTYAPVVAGAKVTPAFPAVAVTKTDDTAGGLSYVGVPSDFSVTLTNSGSRAATTSAHDELPAGWSYASGSATVSRDGGATTSPAEPVVDGRTLTWTDLGALGTAERLVLRYRAVPGDTVTTGSATRHVNHVTATVRDGSGSTSYDRGRGAYVTYPDAADGSPGSDATATARIDRADLTIAATATTADVVAGATTPRAWTVTVSNAAGADPARGTTVVSRPTLPEGAAVSLSAASSAAGWTCTVTDGSWTCANGAVVAAGQAFPPLSFDLSLPSDAPLRAVPVAATITQRPGQTDDGGSGASATATITPIAVADLVAHKETAQDTVVAGDLLSWSLAVENRVDLDRSSVSDARGTVRLTDTLPEQVALQRVTVADGSGWTCTSAGQDVTCERVGLRSGTTAGGIVVTGVVHGDLRAGTVVRNRATTSVDGPTTDPQTGNDTSAWTETTVSDATALTLSKAFVGPLVAGRDAAWAITVENTGTADARDVVVHDDLEQGTALVDGRWTGDGWTCTGTTSVDCTLDGSLGGGTRTTFTLPVTTPSSLTGALDNTAEATWSNRDGRVAAARGSASSAESGHAVGLHVTKRAAAETVEAGTDTVYTIVVSNPDGPSDLPAGSAAQPALTVVDRLPSGFTSGGLTPASAAHWTASTAPDGTVTITSVEGLAVGATAPAIELLVHVAADRPVGAVTNRVVVTPGSAPGPDARAAAEVVVLAHADLAVTKTRTSAPTADAGTEVTYDVTVRNDGPAEAQRVSWRDVAPDGMAVSRVTTDADGWRQAAGDPATWTRDTLAVGASATFHVTATIAPSTDAGTRTNTATVTSATPDTDPSDDTATADVTVTTHARITLTKTPVTAVGATTTVDRVTAGAQQVWLLRTRNEGPSDARPSTVVTDRLPAGVRFVAATSEGAAWTCVDAAEDATVTCALPSTVAAGSEAPALWITTAVASSYTGTRIVNTAAVTAQGTPAPDGSDTAPSVAAVAVDRVANVAVTIGHRGTAVIGEDLPATLRVRNDGPSDAAGVRLRYTLPSGLGYDSADTGDAWSVEGVVRHRDGSTTVTFALSGALAAGSDAPPVTVHQTPATAAYPGVTPRATVTTATTESTTDDNHDRDAVAVAASADVSVTKTHTGALVRGKTVGYTVTVRNDGRTEDPGPVVVTDALPAGLVLVSVDDGGAATCTTGRTVVCTLTEPLASGASVALQVTVRVDQDAPDRITNVATVSSPTAQAAADGAPARLADAMRAEDPAGVADAPSVAGLAFTGAAGLGSGLVLALLAMLAGAVLLLVAARRRRT